MKGTKRKNKTKMGVTDQGTYHAQRKNMGGGGGEMGMKSLKKLAVFK
jgi:hypothetical protein